ncbi:MAG TPA: ABC transporter ATP-binding protein, partial [Pseudolysinimonas sp.]|nr:ABC transporter ATP-binding protein [Pseudolysinimonas sp.]
GKSTTAHAILGALPAGGHITSGSISVGSTDITHGNERLLRRIRGRIVGLVPQDPMVGLNPTLRIGEQVAEAVRLRGVPRRSVLAEVHDALQRAGLDQVELRARQYPHELSGGLRQRALIAIALAGKPRLIIADEPTSALDSTVQRKILDHLVHLVEGTGIALAIITHDLGVAVDRADRLLVMSQGRVVEQGSPHDVLSNPRHDDTRRLLNAAPGLAHLRTTTTARTVARVATVPDAQAAPILRLESITKEFALPRVRGSARTFRAVDDLSLVVHRGQTLALVGESGSGKTTALRVAMRLEAPTSGRVIFDGEDITTLTWRALRPLRQRFQLVHQNPFASLDPRFSVARIITEPLDSFGIATRNDRVAIARDLLDRVGLPPSFLGRRPVELSGGQRQRVAIARALSLKPELLLLDEPVSALDVSVQAQILDLLVELQRDLGLSYLVISHDLAVVAEISHRVAVMSAGRIVEEGHTARVFTNPRNDLTRELISAIPGQRESGPLAAELVDESAVTA